MLLTKEQLAFSLCDLTQTDYELLNDIKFLITESEKKSQTKINSINL